MGSVSFNGDCGQCQCTLRRAARTRPDLGSAIRASRAGCRNGVRAVAGAIRRVGRTKALARVGDQALREARGCGGRSRWSSARGGDGAGTQKTPLAL